jgi:hypothetical protein
MFKLLSVAAAASILIAPSIAGAKAPPQASSYPPAWGQPAKPEAVRHFRRHARRKVLDIPAAAAVPPIQVAQRKIGALEAQLADLRRELAEVSARVGRAPRWDAAVIPGLGLVGMPAGRPAEVASTLASLPDLRSPEQPPSLPVPLPAAHDGQAAVDRARAYLVATATPGYTMARQGPEVAIGRLHPEFAERLAEAIRKARSAGLGHAGVFSAYRPPIFGIGGFGDKFNSLHSYGLAADIAGIGSAGSTAAHLWQKIVEATGLFLPYGADNRAEHNHVQLVPTKVAARAWRRTITAQGPRDLHLMWTASGVKVPAPMPPVNSADMLPEVNWGRQ